MNLDEFEDDEDLNTPNTTMEATDAQLRYIRSLLKKHQYSEDELLYGFSDELGREPDSLEDLSISEASRVIDFLKKD